jgi:hypothetical protein
LPGNLVRTSVLIVQPVAVGKLADLVKPASAGEGQALPVSAQLAELFGGRGLRRGTTVAISRGPASVTLLLATLAAASQAGSWCAIAGLPHLGVVAAEELGVVLERLALVPCPGPQWTTVASILIDGFDLVVIAPAGPVPAAVSTQLAARARQRGSVLIALAPPGGWEGAEITLSTEAPVWHGLGRGTGRLRCREVTISARGRGAAQRPRRITALLPSTCPDDRHTCGKVGRTEPTHLRAVKQLGY